jgi:hypothetical protein
LTTVHSFAHAAAAAVADRFVEVSMKALVEHADINVDDVAVLQRTRIGNAVADAFVHGTEKTTRTSEQVERRPTSEQGTCEQTLARKGRETGKRGEALIRKVQK